MSVEITHPSKTDTTLAYNANILSEEKLLILTSKDPLVSKCLYISQCILWYILFYINRSLHAI